MVFQPQHVTAEGTALVKQAEDAASNKKVCVWIIFFFFQLISLRNFCVGITVVSIVM